MGINLSLFSVLAIRALWTVLGMVEGSWADILSGRGLILGGSVSDVFCFDCKITRQRRFYLLYSLLMLTIEKSFSRTFSLFPIRVLNCTLDSVPASQFTGFICSWEVDWLVEIILCKWEVTLLSSVSVLFFLFFFLIFFFYCLIFDN